MSMSNSLDTTFLSHTKFTELNSEVTDFFEWLQYINRILALSSCIWLHVAICSRLFIVNNFRVISDYQRLIIVQSVINIIASVFELIVNEIQTVNLDYVKIGHPFWHFSHVERVIYTISMETFSTSSQDFLMLFNLHRLFIIKKKSLVLLYSIAIPLMLIGPISDAVIAYPVILSGQDMNVFFKHGQVPLITVVIVICYVKLKKEFATNQSFSEKTRKLQEKLSCSILVQVVMLFAILVIISIIPVVILIVFGEDVYQLHAAKYTIVVCLGHHRMVLISLRSTHRLVYSRIFQSTKPPGNHSTL
ncbi:Serpentine Receptor, class H [Caenorhabditis elegans]|uniref:Serpentine Receptor, class H n=1 Tax=Caenorhabditis elegans TaxID=6239 RepID=Q9XUW3_CAEEL|nr:Serpentine Receptor, class H [Caenorhabditis elegans]CAB04530.2 Serpentine Receptor, class H [Caenorhabditis elegans]|eukprot:NP_507470.2 Uncharacterized protein CELE_F59A1.11 [Caenorhabditis elegans]